MLFFQLELVEVQKGVPEGFMFVWLGDGPDPLFPAMDLNGDKEVPLEEVPTKTVKRAAHASSEGDGCPFP